MTSARSGPPGAEALPGLVGWTFVQGERQKSWASVCVGGGWFPSLPSEDRNHTPSRLVGPRAHTPLVSRPPLRHTLTAPCHLRAPHARLHASGPTRRLASSTGAQHAWPRRSLTPRHFGTGSRRRPCTSRARVRTRVVPAPDQPLDHVGGRNHKDPLIAIWPGPARTAAGPQSRSGSGPRPVCETEPVGKVGRHLGS